MRNLQASAEPAAGAGSSTVTIDPPLYSRDDLDSTLGPALGHKARIGAIVLASDHTIEYEWRGIMERAAEAAGGPETVALYNARIRNEPSINPETLAAMEARIADTASLLLPGMPFDVIAYACTAATIVIGPERVRERVHETRPDVLVTDPVSAMMQALDTMGVRRFALVTPYIESVSHKMRRYFVEAGYDVPVMGSFSRGDDNQVARIDAESIRAAALEFGRRPEVDGLFVSCTAIRMTGLVDELEQALGKPVTCSNHAMAWHALRLAGIDVQLDGLGRLFREH